jgi:Phosphotransferase enzyme family
VNGSFTGEARLAGQEHQCITPGGITMSGHTTITTGTGQELLAGASHRERVQPDDARAGAIFERVTAGADSFFVKRLSASSDWIMRIAGDHVHRPYQIWRSGVMDQAPGCVDHTVVAMDLTGAPGDDAVLTIVMRDVGDLLVPPGDTIVPAAQHTRFIAHMAALSGAFWEWQDQLGLTTMAQRLRFFAPDNIAAELGAAEVPGPLAAAAAGWPALAERSPLLSAAARSVQDDPGVLTARLSRLPGTFLHGDWKMGNLGSHPDGRTVLLDWTLPGAGPACWDLCWYLALNRARLPEGKEAAISRFRAELEGRGIATAGWWQEQLDLCLIGIMATFGWEKALGDADELSWWEARVAGAAARQHIPIPAASR